MSGIIYETPESGFYTVDGWLNGNGEYAGYTFVFQEERDLSDSPPRILRGIIYRGQPPDSEPRAE